MFVSLGAEFSAAAWAVLFGFSLGLAYHALFVLRVLCGVSAGSALPARLSRFHFPYIRLEGGKGVGARGRLALLFVFDFLFALGGGLSFLVFLYAVHDGAFRFFLLFSAMLGMLLYFLTLGRLVFRVLGTLSYLLHVLLSYLFLAVKIPLFLLFLKKRPHFLLFALLSNTI